MEEDTKTGGEGWFSILSDEEKALIKAYIKSKSKGLYDIAKYITEKFDIITIGEKERDMYVYENGYYCKAENRIVYPEIQRIMGHYATKANKGEVFAKMADMTFYDRSIFASADLRYIPLSNGVYDTVTETLTLHSPSHRFTYQFPVIYDPTASCPKTSAFMEQILDESQKATVEEWLGYLFYRNYMFKKAIIMVGEGDTGKTTLLEVITYLVGKENMSGVSLHKMSSDRFSVAQLYGKHVNIWDELSAHDITDTGAFKMATGGGTITGEHKFGNQFAFNNHAKLTFACNRIPDVQDFSDEAYFNRWMVIRFGKRIDKKVLNFIKTLTTEEERSGLFNVAMVGLKRLIENNGFTYAASAVDTKLEMMRNGSSIARFVQDKLERAPMTEVTGEDMYAAYQTFCEENGGDLETSAMLGHKLPFYASYIIKGQVADFVAGKTKQVRGWRNVRIKLTAEEEAENEKAEKWYEENGEILKKQAELIIKAV